MGTTGTSKKATPKSQRTPAAVKPSTVKQASAKPTSAKPTKVKKVTAGARNISNVSIGQPVAAFQLPSTSERDFDLNQLRGRSVVVYFYPKDNTPGCTLEGQDFRKLYASFQKLRCDIVGISRDSLRAHQSFKKKCGFPFELLSDEKETVCRQFGVIQMKKLYGREFEGIERSTFLIDQKGLLAKEWRKVKVDGHAQAVLEAVKELK